MVVGRKSPRSLTPLELKIMQALWRIGPANVQGVRRALCPESNLAYTSVQTVLNILESKGKVKRTLRGRAYQYRAVVSQKKICVAMLNDLVDRVFAGSTDQLILTLMDTHPECRFRIRKLMGQVADSTVDG